MNNTQKFAELDKLSGELSYPNSIEEFRKTPQGKKWNQAREKLPEKEKKEYLDHIRQKEISRREEKRQNLKEILEHTKLHPHVKEWLQDQLTNEEGDFNVNSYPEIKNQDLSKKRTVFFTFAEEGKKNKPWHLAAGFTFAHKKVQKNKEDLANLCIPETVTIDYSEYSDVTVSFIISRRTASNKRNAWG